MIRSFFLWLVIVGLGLDRAASLAAQSPTGREIFLQHCAGCHGRDLEGVNGHALKKKDWIYGREPTLMLQTILHGLPGTEMVAWRSVLTSKQAEAVRDYVIEAQDAPPFAIREIPDEILVAGKKVKLTVAVREGLNTPWGIEFVDARRALVTERTGGLRWVVEEKLDPRPITGLPVSLQYADAGLMDLALDPEFSKNGWIYLALSHALTAGTDRDSPGMTKVVRGRIADHRWIDEQALFALPAERYLKRAYRWVVGCCSIGRGTCFSASVIWRATPTCRISRGRVGKFIGSTETAPFRRIILSSGREDAIAAIYTYGNRNPQGLALHPVTGDIWETEHGPMGGDELNILKKGANYGWPLVTFGRNYNGTEVSALPELPGLEPPVVQWTPSIAVCPAEFYTGSLFPEWKNNLFVGALAYEEVRRLVIRDRRVVAQEVVLKNLGRVRDLKTGPDGAIYVLLNHPDVLVRLTPGS